MKPRNPTHELNGNKVHSLLDRREAERAPVECRVTYSGEACLPEGAQPGTLCDLSKTGCQVMSLTPPALGSRITLTLHLQDGQAPMCLVGSTVCQIRGPVFGVSFPSLSSDDRRRLLALILKRATVSDSARTRTAFRIV